MKIAILDSGINLNYKDFSDKIINHINFVQNEDIKDLSGHGTACAGEILKISPDAELEVIKILDKSTKGNLANMFRALEYCLERDDIRVINISISCDIKEQGIIQLYEDMINELYKKNKIVIASMLNGLNKGYPALYNNAIGVNLIFNFNRQDYYHFDNKCNCSLYGQYRLMPWKDSEYRFFKGNSSATPRISAIVYNILQRTNFNNDELLDYLKNRQININEYEDYSEIIIENIKSILINNKVIVTDKLNEMLNNKDTLLFMKFIKYIENYVGLNLDYKKLTVNDFESIYTFLNTLVK